MPNAVENSTRRRVWNSLAPNDLSYLEAVVTDL